MAQRQRSRREDGDRWRGITLAGENVEDDIGGMDAVGDRFGAGGFLSKVPTIGTRIALRPVEPHEGGGRVVLNNLSEQIRECLRHAEDCARKAAAQSCPNLKQDFLDLEQRWLFLGRSYEFTERLTDLSVETKRTVDKLPRV